jgi:SAM-dependent methyltransferase
MILSAHPAVSSTVRTAVTTEVRERRQKCGCRDRAKGRTPNLLDGLRHLIQRNPFHPKASIRGSNGPGVRFRDGPAITYRVPSARPGLLTSSRTLAHYEAHASTFWEGTKDHDVSQNYAALLNNIEGPPPFVILDFGCGPGRDLAYFRSLGHEAVGLEGCRTFCSMARGHSGCEVLEQDFLALSLPQARFDGVFANASLFHVPTHELPRVLSELREALKPRGVLFCSNPRGASEEGWHGERYGCYWALERWRTMVTAAGFEEITHYYRPAGKPCAEQPWLASVWRK